MEGQESGSSVSLADFVGHEFGDFDQSSETPGSPDTGAAAGTPPPSTQPETPESTTGPDGTKDAERTGTPPIAAAPTAPETGAPKPVADDPFANAKPATYTVDGQERTYDGIKVLGEDGAIIEASALPDVLRRLGERDHLVTVNQQQYRERQALEPLTSWKTTGDDGKEQTLTGQAGLTALHVDYARQSAALSVIDAILSDPAKAIQLVGLAEDGKTLIWDSQALEYLMKDVRLAASDAEGKTRRSLQSTITEASKPVPVPINYEAEAPLIIKAVAGADLAKLTPEDHKFLATQLPFYTQGKTVNAEYGDLVKDRIARRVELAKTSTVITNANTTNAARLLAASRGQKPAAPKPKAPTQTEERATTSDAMWDHMHSLAGRSTKAG